MMILLDERSSEQVVDAVSEGNLEAMARLYAPGGLNIDHCAKVGDQFMTPLGIALTKTGRNNGKADFATIEWLIAHGADLFAETDLFANKRQGAQQPFFHAFIAYCGEQMESAGFYDPCLEFICSMKPDFTRRNSDGDTPLAIAIGSGNKKLVERLLDSGAPLEGATASSPGGEDYTPLNVSFDVGNAELFGLLIERGADLCAYGKDMRRILEIDDIDDDELEPLESFKEILISHFALLEIHLKKLRASLGFGRPGTEDAPPFHFPECPLDDKGGPSPFLLQLAGAQKLDRLFDPGDWKGRTDDARAFYQKLDELLPPHYRVRLYDVDCTWMKAEPEPVIWAKRQAVPALPLRTR